ncbi:hypothetical protein [Streptomyces sp. S.PB5]|uniref:hypothetical protein n=1 Tax=Streptomyces sp. S.PB5 TaxID=3020844 RepID=UPI0025B062A5|nr:hypothetical protein [Streptomyces sp. S.PB5]MDN3022754.1 hypothetical protein [Streptomyces sp. S.PB5]
MRGKRAVSAAMLGLALAATIGGAAQASTGPVPSGKAAAAVRDLSGLVTATESGTANGQPTVACCPAGKMATGGGVQTNGKANVVDSYPDADGNGWIGTAVGSDPSTPVTVYVICG